MASFRMSVLGAAFVAALLPSTGRADKLAATDGETPGTRAEVTELKRVSGGAVMLRFTVYNDGDKDIDFAPYLNSHEGRSVDGVYLVDLGGKKKYEVVRDDDKHCVCSRSVPNMRKQSSVNLWAKFPAPPDTVEKVGIVIPHFIPLDDVPLAK